MKYCILDETRPCDKECQGWVNDDVQCVISYALHELAFLPSTIDARLNQIMYAIVNRS